MIDNAEQTKHRVEARRLDYKRAPRMPHETASSQNFATPKTRGPFLQLCSEDEVIVMNAHHLQSLRVDVLVEIDVCQRTVLESHRSWARRQI